MRLLMAGLDYTTAEMDVREMFSPDATMRRDMLRGMMTEDVSGCVIVSTCNRTELYISYRGDIPPDSVDMLCRAFGQETHRYRNLFVERYERQAVEHLMLVAAGMRSSVIGDDQIITQVREAAEEARGCETVDAFLEVLFRMAVSAGKKVKNTVWFTRDSSSVAGSAVKEIMRTLGPLSGRRALVIGSGVIGILVAAEMRSQGCEVGITYRDPRRKDDFPEGCRAIEFAERVRALPGCDVVISATSSPHFTLRSRDLDGMRSFPKLFVDLAVPRDIDPAIGGMPGVSLINVDMLGDAGTDGEMFRKQIAEAECIVQEEARRFDLWRRNRRRYGRSESGMPDFPLFINLHGVHVLIAGGGKVAARRAEKLLGSGARVHVVSPDINQQMRDLLGNGNIRWTPSPYHPRHMDGVTLVIAATDQREVNAHIGEDARKRGVLVSVADRRQECTFYFPAIVKSDFLVAGLVSNNGDHHLVKRAAVRMREEMEAIDADYQSGEPR